MIDLVRMGWAALKDGEDAEGPQLKANPVGVHLPSGSVLLGVDALGRMHLLLPCPAPGPEDDSLEAVHIGHRRLAVSGVVRDYVDVSCELREAEEAFDHLVVAIIEAVARETEKHPATIAISTLAQWRRLLRTSGRALSHVGLSSLFAELVVMRDIAGFPGADIEAWRGPGARHDFTRGDVALEVKSTLAHTSRVVTIHGLDQLEPPEGGELFLEFVRLEDSVEAGESVPLLVDQLIERGLPTEALWSLVERGGVAPAQYEEARRITFRVRERALLPVAEAFPKITSAVFPGGEVPVGINDVNYRSDLDSVMSDRLMGTRVSDVYRRIAEGGA